MRTAQALIGLGALAVGTAALEVAPAGAVCSVFDKHPCMPTVCSVFHHAPCIPDINYWIGQDLRLTIESASASEQSASVDAKADSPTDRKLDTLRTMFDALRACWVPPAQTEARAGTQMSVRFSFKRSGDIIATPRVTYVSPGVPVETRDIYLRATSAALERCAPLPFSEGLGGAVVGRPIAIRFVDNRDRT